jgi:hypothetical protein
VESPVARDIQALSRGVIYERREYKLINTLRGSGCMVGFPVLRTMGRTA